MLLQSIVNSPMLKISTLFCCALFMAVGVVYAQKPVPKFSADVTVGCAPLIVSFSDESEGAISLEWDINNDGIYDYFDDYFPVHTYTAPGYYSVKLRATSIDQIDSLVKLRYIRVTTPVLMNLNNSYSVCAGDSVLIKGTVTGGVRPYKYFWEAIDFPFVSTDSTPRFSPDTTRMWRVTVTDSVGCSVERNFQIVVLPTPEKPVIHVEQKTMTANGSGAAIYNWYKNGVLIPGATTKSFTITGGEPSDKFKVVAIGNSGCKSQSDEITPGIASVMALQPDGWAIYPNPMNDALTVRCLEAGVQAEIHISNALGIDVAVGTVGESSDRRIFDLHHLPQGVYMVCIMEANRKQVYKIVKE